MRREGLTVRDATEMWVGEMNAIPQGMIDKLMRADPDDWHEVTRPSGGDRVYVYEVPDGCDHYGEIVEYDEDEEKWNILLDSHETIGVSEEDFEMDRDSFLPMWGTMWSFGDSCDDWWLEEGDGIQVMSNCGFRIYESEEFGYFFGIDGAGYSFFEAHWCPLYRARGLQWHDPETEKEAS